MQRFTCLQAGLRIAGFAGFVASMATLSLLNPRRSTLVQLDKLRDCASDGSSLRALMRLRDLVCSTDDDSRGRLRARLPFLKSSCYSSENLAQLTSITSAVRAVRLVLLLPRATHTTGD